MVVHTVINFLLIEVSPSLEIIAGDFVRQNLIFKLSANEFSMASPLVATCRSGCALCEALTSRLNGLGGATSFEVVTVSSTSVATRFVISAWKSLKNDGVGETEVLKCKRPAPSSRASPQPAPVFCDAGTPGMSLSHPPVVGGRARNATNCM